MTETVKVLQTMPKTTLEKIAFGAVEMAIKHLHGGSQAVGMKQPLGTKPGGWGYSPASIPKLFREIENVLDDNPSYIRVSFGSDAAALAGKSVGDLCTHLVKIAQVSNDK